MVLFSNKVMSDSSAMLRVIARQVLCPWGFPGRNTGVGCHFLLQRIFPIQELNPYLLRLLMPRRYGGYSQGKVWAFTLDLEVHGGWSHTPDAKEPEREQRGKL